MQEIYIYAFLSVIAVSAISLMGLFALSINERILKKASFVLVSLAVGALLGDSFIHLIPESNEVLGSTVAGVLVIGGMLIFFTLEKILHWHHQHGLEDQELCHGPDCDKADHSHIHPTGVLVLVGDSLHNLLDGIIIGASYLVSIEIGIATTIAIILHEIPQEIGDFGILIHSGFTKARALLFNFFSGITAVAGVAIALFLSSGVSGATDYIIPVAAGGLIYIAGTDLVPELQKTRGLPQALIQLFAFLVGVGSMIALTSFEV